MNSIRHSLQWRTSPLILSCPKQSMQSFPQYLAAALMKGTQRKFSRLHADYLEEEQQVTDTPNPEARPVEEAGE